MSAGPVAYQEHPGLAWLRGSERGRAFLAALPGLVAGCVERWSLTLGEPFPYAHASLALPATLLDGTDAVLKVAFPDRESEFEAAALRCYDGNGAVRLLDHDADRWALLLERCRPGTSLAELDNDAAIAVMVDLLPRLLVPAGAPFGSLADEAVSWAAELARQYELTGQPFDRPLFDLAMDLLDALPGSQSADQVLLHQDLHADNVLRATREPWLVIDPKPLVGEREFAVAPLVRGPELGHSRALVRRRLDALTAELGLDRERARGWAIAQTLSWGFERDRVLPNHVEVARWLAEDR